MSPFCVQSLAYVLFCACNRGRYKSSGAVMVRPGEMSSDFAFGDQALEALKKMVLNVQRGPQNEQKPEKCSSTSHNLVYHFSTYRVPKSFPGETHGDRRTAPRSLPISLVH